MHCNIFILYAAASFKTAEQPLIKSRENKTIDYQVQNNNFFILVSIHVNVFILRYKHFSNFEQEPSQPSGIARIKNKSKRNANLTER